MSLNILTTEDRALALSIIGGERDPDLIIAPDGNPYLYRWHVVPRNTDANVYFHIQTASDPERPLHDHPWDNVSVILSGGYTEIISQHPESKVYDVQELPRKKGDVIFRKAEEAHRLVLPAGVPYTMTLFTTGPKRRAWGFWQPRTDGTASERTWKWVDAMEIIESRGNVSVQKKGE